MFSCIKKWYITISKPAKASIWFVICYVIQRGMQFLSMPVYTRIMSQKDYGTYSVFFSWFNVICVFTSLNIYSGTFNKAMVKYERERKEYISSVQTLTTVTTLILALLTFGFKDVIRAVTGFSDRILVLMWIHLQFFPTFQYWAQELRFRFEYKPFVIVTILNSLVSTALGILVTILSRDKSTSLITVVVFVQAVISLILYLIVLKRGKCLFKKDYWKWSIGLAIPLIPHYLSEILLGHSDRLMINQMCGAAQAGIYNIVYQIAMVMTIIRTGINGAFAPWLYYSIKNKQYEAIREVTNSLAVLMFLLSAFIMALGPEILKIAAPKSYYEAVINIPAIMIGGFFIFIYVLFVYVETYYEEKLYVSIASILSAILNIVLNWFYIRKYGYLAAGYTTMISYMAMAVMHYLFLKKISLKYKEIIKLFDIKFLLYISGAILVVGIGCLKLYQYTVIRYLAIMVLLVSMWVKRNKITALINRIKKR